MEKKPYKVVYEFPGSSPSCAHVDPPLISVSKLLRTELTHKLPTRSQTTTGWYTQGTDSNSTTKALNTKLKLEPQPTKSMLELSA